MMAGKLVVLEGTDGSGKSTQFAALCRRMQETNHPFERLVFPQYQEPSSALIRMYLAGEFGTSPGDVNPYAASAFYAVDRYASLRKVWGAGYEAGGLVLSDRYTTSNAVHQTAKCRPEERAQFLRWLDDFEHEKIGLPRPDLVIYLDVPTEMTADLMKKRQQDTATTADIHETDFDYLATCRTCGTLAAELMGWKRVVCADEKGKMRSIEDIHAEIWTMVQAVIS